MEEEVDALEGFGLVLDVDGDLLLTPPEACRRIFKESGKIPCNKVNSLSLVIMVCRYPTGL